jgi:hypothetical protein
MKKNIIASVVFGLILVSFYPVKAQQPTKVRKIGFLASAGPRGPMRYSGEVCGSLAMRRVITLSLSTGPPRVDHGCLSWPMS